MACFTGPTLFSIKNSNTLNQLQHEKFSLFFAGLFLLLLSVGANAQSKPGSAYFAGKWSVLLKGTPGGDVK